MESPGDRARRPLPSRKAISSASRWCGSTARGWGRWTPWQHAHVAGLPEAGGAELGPSLLGVDRLRRRGALALVLGALAVRRPPSRVAVLFESPDVILTVTLNAAIDRTVAVPNFRLGQRHRAVESRTVAGGKGVNVARALKLLGRPVIATGLVGGSAGTRIVERLGEESILNDFTRIAGESRTNLAVVDPTNGEQTEINERGPQVTPGGGRPVRREAPLPRPGRVDLRPRRVDPSRRVTPTSMRGSSSELKALQRDDGARHRWRADAGRASRRARGGRPERARGRGGRRLRVQRRRRPRDGARAASWRWAPERRSSRAAEGCAAIVGAGPERRRYEVETDQMEPISAVGSGDAFLAGYVAARYEGRSPSGTASPTALPVAPSRPSISAPERSIRARWNASSRASAFPRLTSSAGVA